MSLLFPLPEITEKYLGSEEERLITPTVTEREASFFSG
jgi:hypothetical protein